jgi:signal transduction histidine kinase/DNA-binding NarL/FixJ family response regulator
MKLKVFQIFLYLLVAQILFCQFPEFGIKRYGNTFQQTFHSANNINQDKYGRLLFDQNGKNYEYDGKYFKSQEKVVGELVLRSEDGSYWMKTDKMAATYFYANKSQTIYLKHYFKKNLSSIYQYGNLFYLVNNDGTAIFKKGKDSLEFVKKILMDKYETKAVFQLNDTLFFKFFNQSGFIKEKGNSTYIYEEQSHSDYDNGIFYLPNDRIVLMQKNMHRVVDDKSSFYKVIKKIKDKEIIAQWLDINNRLWLSIRGEKYKGLYYVINGSTILNKVNLDVDEKTFIIDIYQDHEGSIWLGTIGEGLIQIYDKAIHVINKNSGLASDNVWSVNQNSNNQILFSSSCGGIDLLDISGSISHFNADHCQEAIYTDKKDRLWVNEEGLTLYQDNVKINNFQKESGLYSRSPKCIFEDDQGQIWIGTRKAIHRFENGKFIPYIIPNVEEYDKVFNIVQYSDGAMLIAMISDRVFTFENEKFVEIKVPFKDINKIIADREKNIWIATTNNGLYQYKNNEFLIVKNSPSTIYQLQEDLKGNLWGITNNNRIFYSPKSDLIKGEIKNIIYLSENNGLPLISVNTELQPTSILLNDGKIIFPNIYGAIAIDVNKIVKSDIQDFQNLIYYKNITLQDNRLILNYAENDVNVEMRSVVLHPNKPVQYQYFYDGKWHSAQDGKIIINNLTYGTHRLKIQSKFGNSPWKESESLYIEVPKLMHQTWWFRLLILFLASILVYSIIRWRLLQIKKQNQLLETKVKEQTNELENEKKSLADLLIKQQTLTHELQLSQKTKNRMYAQISHEFRSPLQTIKSFLSHQSNPLVDTESKKRIEGNIQNLLNISNEILELSKAESGNLKVNKKFYNINNLIHEQINLIKPLLEEKNILIQFSANKNNLYLEFDISLMQKAIANLLSNAIKFSHNNGKIIVSSQSKDNLHYISIQDYGEGIESHELDNLTLPYYRASNNAQAGTGIGLSLVEQILKLHDSKLEIKSEIGKGSMFSFMLKVPAVSQKEIMVMHKNQLALDDQIKAIINPNKPLVLAVDDSENILYFIKEALQKDCNVIALNDGVAALEALGKINPTLIISDVKMPLMNGITLLDEVRKIPKYGSLPFLFLTGSITDNEAKISQDLGVDYILKKPISEEELHVKINQVLKRQTVIKDAVKSDFAHSLLPPNIQGDDYQLIRKMEEVILLNITNPLLKSEDIANQMGLGEKTLRIRVKNITGLL